ncbi:HEXXH motif domain-containing protein [Amycolatopsis sp. CA-128772]|uniref:HEXXH motif domain-containing protein n=1 Tax=Amycolatopsis sp. CA-128772 TaxID=2073159 RepID=UPI001E51DBCC|nr:HEXXH motif domain-containing protein [Amycolatopsis sp. CA-128772]
MLLLRGLVDETTKRGDAFGPLPSAESAWELLARAQHRAPDAVEILLAHPYTGSWAGYTTRLLHQQVSGTSPLWVHIGHIHCIAAAAAIRAGLGFETAIPLWQGDASLPTLGAAHLTTDEPFATATVRSDGDQVFVENDDSRVRLPRDWSVDRPGWSGLRQAAAWSGEHRLVVRLDDLDPYRGLYQPVPPRRLTAAEAESWRTTLEDAWRLLVAHIPEVAEAMAEGLDSIVPAPAVPFRLPSASTGEAFGSAIIAHPSEPAVLAAALVHEFQHIRLGGIQHLVRLSEDDKRQRIYAPWRDDPRPIAGVIHGIFAFFGVTLFWRAKAQATPEDRLAAFEFALWRTETWRTLQSIRRDAALTSAGRRLLDGVAERLGPWQHEPVDRRAAEWAALVAADHLAGWRARHLRADPDTITRLSDAWRAGETRPWRTPDPGVPTPVPDGSWPDARADLIRLTLGEGEAGLDADWQSVPGSLRADYDLAAHRSDAAVAGYRRELTTDPDNPSALVGLGLALTQRGANAAGRTLLHHPELVRALHRSLRTEPGAGPSPEALAGWLGRFTH